MKLERHEIAGFFNFPEPFVLDCADLPAGLIAIVGSNGAGKTSLALDGPLAGLYGPGQTKAFPSREGTLAEYATDRKAYIDTRWSFDGQGIVRARVNVDGTKRTADAVLEAIGPDGRATALNDGKVSTFRDAVKARFPSLRSLLVSAFAAQNKRGSFGDLGQKERVELFAELADLAHYETLSQTAKRCQQAADGIASRLRAAIDVLNRDADPETVAAILNRLTAIATETSQRALAVSVDRLRLKDLDADRVAFAVAAERYAVAQARLDGYTTAVTIAARAISEHDSVEERRRSAYALAARTNDGMFRDATESIARRKAVTVAAYEAASADRAARITNNRAVLADGDSIRAAATRLPLAEAELAVATDTENTLQASLTDAVAAGHVAAQTLAAINVAERNLEAARSRTLLLARVKYGDQCAVDPVCPLVTDAVAARASIAGLAEIVAQASGLRADVLHIRDTEAAYDQRLGIARMTIRERRSEIARLKPVAALSSHLDFAEQKIAEYLRDGLDADGAYTKAMTAYGVEVASAESARANAAAESERADGAATLTAADRRGALVLRFVEAQEAVTDATAERDRTAGAKADLDRNDTEHAETHAQINANEITLARLDQEREGLERNRAELTRRQAQAAEMSRHLRIIEDEGLAWRTLATACGRDGLPRLEIDAAGPVVSDLANQLLEVGYGTRFAVRIVTQVATADGSGLKERFTIEVLDNAHGGEPRDIGDLSGGERVVVEEAVRAALSCYVNLRSQQPCRTIFRDETTGALDPENAPRYVSMLRKLRDLSGAEHVFYITHSPECAALADAQVRVVNGKATIALPPYAEAA